MISLDNIMLSLSSYQDSCKGQGQGAGTAAALCALRKCGTRDLPYSELRQKLEKAGVYFES